MVEKASKIRVKAYFNDIDIWNEHWVRALIQFEYFIPYAQIVYRAIKELCITRANFQNLLKFGTFLHAYFLEKELHIYLIINKIEFSFPIELGLEGEINAMFDELVIAIFLLDCVNELVIDLIT